MRFSLWHERVLSLWIVSFTEFSYRGFIYLIAEKWIRNLCFKYGVRDKCQNSVLNIWLPKYTLPTAHVSDTCLQYVCSLSVNFSEINTYKVNYEGSVVRHFFPLKWKRFWPSFFIFWHISHLGLLLLVWCDENWRDQIHGTEWRKVRREME